MQLFIFYIILWYPYWKKHRVFLEQIKYWINKYKKRTELIESIIYYFMKLNIYKKKSKFKKIFCNKFFSAQIKLESANYFNLKWKVQEHREAFRSVCGIFVEIQFSSDLTRAQYSRH